MIRVRARVTPEFLPFLSPQGTQYGDSTVPVQGEFGPSPINCLREVVVYTYGKGSKKKAKKAILNDQAPLPPPPPD